MAVGVVVGVSVAVGGVGGSGRWRQQRVAAVAGGDDNGGKLGWHHPTQQLTTVMLKRPFHGVVQDEEKPEEKTTYCVTLRCRVRDIDL